MRHILINYRSQALAWNKETNLLKYFFVANGFHDFENNCFGKKTKVLINFARFLFLVYLLSVLIKEKVYATFLGFAECSIEHILRGQVWLYGFDSNFSQVSINFFVVSKCCF